MSNNIHAIPTSFRLRRRKWTVKNVPGGKVTHAGQCIRTTPKQIELCEKTFNRKRTPGERQKTFWHEATHAVLDEMGHKLVTDEKFVTRFGLLLEELIRTARFS